MLLEYIGRTLRFERKGPGSIPGSSANLRIDMRKFWCWLGWHTGHYVDMACDQFLCQHCDIVHKN